jgi:hypothetical protein
LFLYIVIRSWSVFFKEGPMTGSAKRTLVVMLAIAAVASAATAADRNVLSEYFNATW